MAFKGIIKNVEDDTTTRLKRRISFSTKKDVRTFTETEKWDKSFEVSDPTNGSANATPLNNNSDSVKFSHTVDQSLSNTLDFIDNTRLGSTVYVDNTVDITLLDNEKIRVRNRKIPIDENCLVFEQKSHTTTILKDIIMPKPVNVNSNIQIHDDDMDISIDENFQTEKENIPIRNSFHFKSVEEFDAKLKDMTLLSESEDSATFAHNFREMLRNSISENKKDTDNDEMSASYIYARKNLPRKTIIYNTDIETIQRESMAISDQKTIITNDGNCYEMDITKCSSTDDLKEIVKSKQRQTVFIENMNIDCKKNSSLVDTNEKSSTSPKIRCQTILANDMEFGGRMDITMSNQHLENEQKISENKCGNSKRQTVYADGENFCIEMDLTAPATYENFSKIFQTSIEPTEHSSNSLKCKSANDLSSTLNKSNSKLSITPSTTIEAVTKKSNPIPVPEFKDQKQILLSANIPTSNRGAISKVHVIRKICTPSIQSRADRQKSYFERNKKKHEEEKINKIHNNENTPQSKRILNSATKKPLSNSKTIFTDSSSPTYSPTLLPCTSGTLNLRDLNDYIESGKIKYLKPDSPECQVKTKDEKCIKEESVNKNKTIAISEIKEDIHENIKKLSTIENTVTESQPTSNNTLISKNFDDLMNLTMESPNNLYTPLPNIGQKININSVFKIQERKNGEKKKKLRYSQVDDMMLDNTSFLTKAKLGDDTQSANSTRLNTTKARVTPFEDENMDNLEESLPTNVLQAAHNIIEKQNLSQMCKQENLQNEFEVETCAATPFTKSLIYNDSKEIDMDLSLENIENKNLTVDNDKRQYRKTITTIKNMEIDQKNIQLNQILPKIIVSSVNNVSEAPNFSKKSMMGIESNKRQTIHFIDNNDIEETFIDKQNDFKNPLIKKPISEHFNSRQTVHFTTEDNNMDVVALDEEIKSKDESNTQVKHFKRQSIYFTNNDNNMEETLIENTELPSHMVDTTETESIVKDTKKNNNAEIIPSYSQIIESKKQSFDFTKDHSHMEETLIDNIEKPSQIDTTEDTFLKYAKNHSENGNANQQNQPQIIQSQRQSELIDNVDSKIQNTIIENIERSLSITDTFAKYGRCRNKSMNLDNSKKIPVDPPLIRSQRKSVYFTNDNNNMEETLIEQPSHISNKKEKNSQSNMKNENKKLFELVNDDINRVTEKYHSRKTLHFTDENNDIKALVIEPNQLINKQQSSNCSKSRQTLYFSNENNNMEQTMIVTASQQKPLNAATLAMKLKSKPILKNQQNNTNAVDQIDEENTPSPMQQSKFAYTPNDSMYEFWKNEADTKYTPKLKNAHKLQNSKTLNLSHFSQKLKNINDENKRQIQDNINETSLETINKLTNKTNLDHSRQIYCAINESGVEPIHRVVNNSDIIVDDITEKNFSKKRGSVLMTPLISNSKKRQTIVFNNEDDMDIDETLPSNQINYTRTYSEAKERSEKIIITAPMSQKSQTKKCQTNLCGETMILDDSCQIICDDENDNHINNLSEKKTYSDHKNQSSKPLHVESFRNELIANESQLETIPIPRKLFTQKNSEAVVEGIIDFQQKNINRKSVVEENPITISDVSDFFAANRLSLAAVTLNTTDIATCTFNTKDSKIPEMNDTRFRAINTTENNEFVKHYINLNGSSSLLDETNLSLVENSNNDVEIVAESLEGDDNIVDENEQQEIDICEISDEHNDNREDAIQVENKHKNKISPMCLKCKRCRQSLTNETIPNIDISFTLPPLPPPPNVFKNLDKLRQYPGAENTEKYLRRISLENSINLSDLDNNLEITPHLEEEYVDPFIIEFKKNEAIIKEEFNKQMQAIELKDKQPFVNRLSKLLNANESKWMFNKLLQIRKILIFSHRKIYTSSVVIKYEEKDLFGQQIEIKAVYLSHERAEKKTWMPIDHVIDFQLKLEVPFDLITLLKSNNENDVFDMLQELHQVFDNVLKLANKFWSIVAAECALLKNENNRIFVEKTIRSVIWDENNMPRVLKQLFRVDILHLRKISYSNISQPQLHLFDEKIQFQGVGLDFMKNFLKNPTQFLKTNL